ncbi:hypothetical protein DFJ74DRAFT_644840 [Hyaloraphidium curvatum]|nr:hypothetical protein DFJ74DRAFT_644840 [Hyaloraphidium curvatum]
MTSAPPQPRTIRVAVMLPDPPDFMIEHEAYAPDCAGGTRYRLQAIFELAAARYFADEVAGFSFDEYIFHVPESWPQGDALSAYDCIFVTGADEGAYDHHVPYVAKLEQYIADNVSRTRWIGLSFGHQVIAWALNPGGRNVMKSFTGWENAAVRAALTPEGREALRTTKEAYHVHNHHGDTVVSPPPGVILVSSSFQTPVQAILSDRVFTNEGHIEYGSGLMECWALWDSWWGFYSREAGKEYLQSRTYLDCDNRMNFLPDAVWLAGKMVGFILGGMSGINSDEEMENRFMRNRPRANEVQATLEKRLCEELYARRVDEFGGEHKVSELRDHLVRWRDSGAPLPYPRGEPIALTNDLVSLDPSIPEPTRKLEFDWPAFSIGVAEYAAGPTGCTVFHFGTTATCAHDVRGGAPGLFQPGDGPVDAICFAGGSYYGLEASTGVLAELFKKRRYNYTWNNLPVVRGAIIYDFRGRENAIHPDKELGRAAFRAAKPGIFPLGSYGAGRSATAGKLFGRGERAGQGGAYRLLAGGIRLACFTVINALGAVYDRSNKIVRGSLDPSQHTVWVAEPGSNRKDMIASAEELLQELATPAQGIMGNTTISLVVTNVRLPDVLLTQLARQVHSSMARGIQPLHCPQDGDQLYMVSTNEIDDPRLNTAALGIAASELIGCCFEESVVQGLRVSSAASLAISHTNIPNMGHRRSLPDFLLRASLLVLLVFLAAGRVEAAAYRRGAVGRDAGKTGRPVQRDIAARQTNETATECHFETYTMSLLGFSFADDSAVWEGWITMVCDANVTLWDTVEILNLKPGGLSVSGQEYRTIPPAAQLGPAFVHWSTMKVQATARVDEDLRYYPFDETYLRLIIEALPDTTALKLVYDDKNSVVAPDVAMDPALALRSGPPTVLRSVVEYSETYLSQIMLPSYLSFAMSLGALVLPVTDHFDARMGILGASIFVVVLNINSLNAFLGFGDYINITTMVLVGLIFIESIVERWLLIQYEAKQEKLAAEKSSSEIEGKAAAFAEEASSVSPHVSTASQRKTTAVAINGDVSDPDEVPSKPARVCWGYGPCSIAKGDSYRDFLVSLSLITFVVALVIYVAVNIGLFVGYRPPSCYPEINC